ncbi:MAG: Hsp20/alpha crystallin family protein [bacterium]|nr:Hsp20/alpha crystallin family protein [bacterium]
MGLFQQSLGDLLRLQKELDSWRRNPAAGFFGQGPSRAYSQVNVFRDAEGLVVRTELPGVAPADVQVNAERRRLTVSGERKADADVQNAGFHRRERAFGRFSRTLILPEDVDVSQAKAEYASGVLTVRIPQHAAAKPRQITVQAA